MASSSSSSSSSYCNWRYDVFPSFSGEDVRTTFLSHFLKELGRKLIIVFKDNKIERSRSLEPELTQAIRDSKIMVVIFSKNYASSSWCLNELVEIVKCKEHLGRLVIPVFYGLDPSHVRKQTGEFGEAFEKTCCNKTDDEIQLWRKSLTDVSNMLGYHSRKCDNEATMIESIANDVLVKLNLTPSKDCEDFVGIDDHIAEMSLLLRLELDEARMVGIWGSSGIGKTIIARALFTRLSRTFQSSVFIDRAFISMSKDIYCKANVDDYNMKLHLQKTLLCEILGQKDIKVDDLGVLKERLKHMKVLIVLDDLEEKVVLNALAGQIEWFGSGSRIILVTKDKHILRSHGIIDGHIYKVGLPSDKQALEMFCRFAFMQNSPPNGFTEDASQVVQCAGNLPLGLSVLGSHFRGRDKEGWKHMLQRVRKELDGKIEKTLRLSYDGLDSEKDKAIFRHIACIFSGEKVKDIKELLADSDLDVDIGLKNLDDKSLLNLGDDIMEMHCLLQEMGREIVRAQSNEPGEREFLVDTKDICDVLEYNTGTKNVIGITLEIDAIDELHVHQRTFHGLRNLRFLKIYTKTWMSDRDFKWHLPKGFNYLPPKLRLLFWDRYPLSFMPSMFRPENLIKLRMRKSKLKKLEEGVPLLAWLKDMDLAGSANLFKISSLSVATNLETLNLSACSSLEKLTTSSIENLNNLRTLDMAECTKIKALPNGVNLQSLNRLNLHGCSRLKRFPDISRNISELFLSETAIEKFPSNLRLDKLVDLRMQKCTKLWKKVQPLSPLMTIISPTLTRLYLSDIPSLVALPSAFQNLNRLRALRISGCKKLELLPVGINLESLWSLNLSRCLRLKTFPDISTNITRFILHRTGIEEVPCWIDKFTNLDFLFMPNCKKLRSVSLNIYKSKHLTEALTEARCLDHVPVVELNFINCFNLDQEALLQQESFIKHIIMPGGQVPSYFTHRTTGNFLTIPLLQIQNPLSSQQVYRFRACAVFAEESMPPMNCLIDIQVSCRFKGRLGNHFDSTDQSCSLWTFQNGSHMVIFDCLFPAHDGNSPHLAQLNYDHVDIQFHLTDNLSKFSLEGCGIRLTHDSTPSSDSQASDSNTVEDITEADESNMDNDGDNETEESGDSKVETERSTLVMQCLARLSCGWKRLIKCGADVERVYEAVKEDVKIRRYNRGYQRIEEDSTKKKKQN